MSSTAARRRTAVCTIVAKNYIHYARTLMDSLRPLHPDWQQFVLLADEFGHGVEAGQDPFHLTDLTTLSLPQIKQFCFRYNILELSTAVKPWLLNWLVQVKGFDRVVYLDPDIFAYAPLREVEAALDRGALMVLTPHLLGELDEGPRPDERTMLRCGTYNLGFIAIQRHAQLASFLDWWQRKLEFYCRVDFGEGLFVDQKWLDLAVGRFEDILLLRHPGYNVAYWNLPQRSIQKRGEQYCVGTQPLVFFHFSGLDPDSPGTLSRFQDRFELHRLGDTRGLVERYCRELHARGHAHFRRLPFAFDCFREGTPIPPWLRHHYVRDPGALQLFGPDPFASGVEVCNERWGTMERPLMTRIMHALWYIRPVLQALFPDPDKASRAAFIEHFLARCVEEENIPEVLVARVREDWRSFQAGPLPKVVSALWAASARRKGRKHKATQSALAPANPLFSQHKPPTGTGRRGEPLRKVVRPVTRLFPMAVRHRAKLLLKRLLGWQHRSAAVALLPGAPRPELPAPQDSPPSPAASAAPRPRPAHHLADGMNIVGYVRSEHGIGESARLCARAAEAAGLSFSVHDFNTGNNSRTGDASWLHKAAGSNPHWANVLHVNADQLPLARRELGEAFFQGRYNIGFWHWELPDFPDMWLDSFDLVDEVWVPSNYVLESVSRKSPVPVVRMPHCIHFEVSRRPERARFGLPDHKFLFLMMYDTHSLQARKNPQGAISAFRRAFPQPTEVALVVKVNNPASFPAEVATLKESLNGVAGVVMLDRILDRQEVYELEAACDCYVSLHRAEGFGLGLAESMFLGKPVIGTNWSANQDFMSAENSCPVHYRLAPLETDHGPYQKGQIWAEPDLDHAAYYMKRIVEDSAWRQRLRAQGQQTIRTRFSPAAVGSLYRSRLGAIAARLGRDAPRLVAA